MIVGLGIGVGFQRVSGGGAAFDSDYQAVLNYATSLGYTLPSSAQQIKQNQLMLDLKAGGIWSKLDTFAMFANDGGSNFGLIDWKRLTTYTAVNSPTFSSNGGFTGNSTSSYVNTNYNCSTNKVNYSLNDAGRFYWIDNLVGNSTCEGTDTQRNHSVSSINNGQRINQDTTVLNIAVNFTASGFRAINRTSSTVVVCFSNTTRTDATCASTTISNSNQYCLRTGTGYGGARMRFYAVGSNLVSENTAFYNAINTYMTSL